jgi:hypothetical protein
MPALSTRGLSTMTKHPMNMREAARELLARQHAATGEPVVCEDPTTYATVAKLLRQPTPGGTDDRPAPEGPPEL